MSGRPKLASASSRPVVAASDAVSSRPASRPLQVMFFGTYSASMHPRVAVLMEGFTDHGDEVSEINVPLGLDTADRVRILKRPWLLPILVVRLVSAWMRLVQRVRRRRGPAPDAVVVGYLGHFDVLLARRLFRGTPLALDHLTSAADTAADRGNTGGTVQRLLRALDRAAVGAADIPFVDTTEQLSLLPERDRPRALVVPVGTPAVWFHSPGPDPTGPVRVVFYGLFTPLQGTATIGRALALLADEQDLEFTMIGHGQDLAACREATAGHPRVRWLDWVSPSELPRLVASHHVALGIFGTGPKALRVVPNKVYQSAAASCAVVTSDTPPQRGAFGGAAVLVPPGDPGALAWALRELARDRPRLATARLAAFDRACRLFRPESVVADLRKHMLIATGTP